MVWSHKFVNTGFWSVEPRTETEILSNQLTGIRFWNHRKGSRGPLVNSKGAFVNWQHQFFEGFAILD